MEARKRLFVFRDGLVYLKKGECEVRESDKRKPRRRARKDCRCQSLGRCVCRGQRVQSGC